jgi:hypothetical protein
MYPSTTQKKYGSYALRTVYGTGTSFGISCSPGGINGLAPSASFDLAKTYTYSFWVYPEGDYACSVSLGSATGGSSHSQTTGTLTALQWTEVTGTWTPASTGTRTDVLWTITVPAGTVIAHYDGFTLVQGTRVLWYPAWLNLAAEADLMQPGQALSGSGLAPLSALNAATGSGHAVTPTMTTPFYTYDSRALTAYTGATSAETFNDDVAEMSGAELVADQTYSGVTVTSGALTASAVSTSGYGYPTRVDAATAHAEQATLQAFADYLRTRYSRTLSRPKMTVVNRFPSMLQRIPNDLITVNYARLGLAGGRYMIATASVKVTQNGNWWETTYQLEEHPY